MAVIGVVSDTHGLLREQVFDALSGCEKIIHAGDVGRPEVLQSLETIAPVVAVRGNCDIAPWARELPLTEVVEIEGKFIYILHDINDLNLDPKSSGFDVVISGHSHRPSVLTEQQVLYLNPGSAGPRGFRLPVSVARLYIESDKVLAEIIEL